MDVAQIERRARAWLQRVCEEMTELATSSWSRRFPGEPIPAAPDERIRRVLDDVAERAVGPSTSSSPRPGGRWPRRAPSRSRSG
jgi:hypothetical protein